MHGAELQWAIVTETWAVGVEGGGKRRLLGSGLCARRDWDRVADTALLKYRGNVDGPR